MESRERVYTNATGHEDVVWTSVGTLIKIVQIFERLVRVSGTLVKYH